MIRMQFHSAEETQAFAQNMAAKLKQGTVVALLGNLGTGKTTFTQGFARGLGIEEKVGSPTFKLVSEYHESKNTLYHVDCYRLKGPEEFLNIGGESLLDPQDGITLIEWAERIEAILPEDTVRINFNRIAGKPDQRQVEIRGWV